MAQCYYSDFVVNPNSSLVRAGQWLLLSGIQSAEGGVARFYRSDLQKSNPVSTEITGYAASALVYLYEKTGDSGYADRAIETARFLTRTAWDTKLQTFPFEWPQPSPAYFFDCGIIVRGLLAVWRMSGDPEFLQSAADGARAMWRDFDSGTDFHPVIDLPSKQALARDARWSRSSGCYQLKAALGWLELADATGDDEFRQYFQQVLQMAETDDAEFLPGSSDENKVMDRLHAYSYYLEACIGAGRDVSHGIARVSKYLSEIGPRFARSDVYAQLLRLRLLSGIAVDEGAQEFQELAKFQASGPDPRIDGGFYFGRNASGFLPYVNPVSTVFALQAMEMWREHEQGVQSFDWRTLI